MLGKEEFLAIKRLAQSIRKDNEKFFDSLENAGLEDSIREKNSFLDNILEGYKGNFSEGHRGKEERQIFRANVLIPDDVEFFESYGNDKNIRSLMEKYKVNIEDVMAKITELNIYGSYIDVFNTPEKPNNEPKVPEKIETPKPIIEDIQEPKKEKQMDFVDELVGLSDKKAESLLEEIENLSKTAFKFAEDAKKERKSLEIEEKTDIEPKQQVEHNTGKIDIDEILKKKIEQPRKENVLREITKEKKHEETPKEIEKPKVESEEKATKIKEEKGEKEFSMDLSELEEEIKPKKSTRKTKIEDTSIDDDFDNISSIVSGFVDEYNKVKKDYANLNGDYVNIKSNYADIKSDYADLTGENKDLESKLKKQDKEIDQLNKEIESLKKNNSEKIESINKLHDENEKLISDNADLKLQITEMREKISKSSALIKKIYNSIPR